MVARADESDEVILARALQIMHTALERRDEELALLRPKAALHEYNGQWYQDIVVGEIISTKN